MYTGMMSHIEPHHIIYSGQLGVDTAENGIGLCALCHRLVHCGTTIKGRRLTGRQYMVYILDVLKDQACWRWTEAYRELQRKVGTGD